MDIKVFLAWLDGAEVSASGWGSGGPRFQSHPRLTFQSCSRYQLNQLGSKAASESTVKKSNTSGVSNNRLYFFFTFFKRNGVSKSLWNYKYKRQEVFSIFSEGRNSIELYQTVRIPVVSWGGHCSRRTGGLRGPGYNWYAGPGRGQSDD